MGTTLSKRVRRSTPRHAPQQAPQTFSARCDEVTDTFLKPICKARTAGSLRSVTLDCRRSGFDEAAVDRVHQAAGGKLVLQL